MEALLALRSARISRAFASVVALLAVFALGGGSGYLVKALSLPAAQPVEQSAPSQLAETSAPFLDRNAERQPALFLDRNAERQQQGQTPRSGGPGGQIGDTP